MTVSRRALITTGLRIFVEGLLNVGMLDIRFHRTLHPLFPVPHRAFPSPSKSCGGPCWQGRRVTDRDTSIDLSSAGEPQLPGLHRGSVVSVCAPSSYRRFLDGPTWQGIVRDLLRGSASPLRPPDKRFRNPHQPRPRGTTLATCVCQAGFVVEGRSAARSIFQCPMGGRGSGRGGAPLRKRAMRLNRKFPIARDIWWK